MAHEVKELDEYEEANALLSDMIMNYRTVIPFGQKNVDQLTRKFESLVQKISNQRFRTAHKAGFLNGFANAGRTIYVSLVYWSAINVTMKVFPSVDIYDAFASTMLMYFAFLSIA